MAQNNQRPGITCEQADLLMVPVWKNRKDWVTRRESEAFNAHLHVCSFCAREFKETTRLMDFLQDNWTGIKGNSQNQSIPTESEAPEKQEMQRTTPGFANIPEAWADFQRCCPEFSEVGLPSSNPSMFATQDAQIEETEMSRITGCRGLRGRGGWLTGIAACLIIGGLIWMQFHGIASHLNQVPPAQSLIPDAGEIVYVKQVMPDGTNITLPTNGPITTSGNTFKRLRINENRQIVLNHHTALSIEPFKSNHLIGCVINLKAGRIQGHVEPDGNPFEVLTPQGKAVITGTIFDVSVTNKETTLIVADGSVRFESSEGSVDVGAGFQSTLQAQSRPSSPTRCDAKSLLAWANGNETHPAIEKSLVDSEYTQIVETLPLQLSYPGRPIDLESLDYEEWVESEREWFRGQFPWIFELQEALVEKASLAASHQSLATATVPDYPELLIEAGDIWQIVYPHRFYRQIPVFQKDNFSKVASSCGLDRSWLGRAPSEPARRTDPSDSQVFFGEEALKQWLSLAREVERDCDNQARVDELSEYCLVNSEYLENNRVLLWLSMQNNKFTVATEHETGILQLLQQQVVAAYSCKKAAWHLDQLKTKDSSTRKSYQREILDAIVEIIGYEEEIQVLNTKLSAKDQEKG